MTAAVHTYSCLKEEAHQVDSSLKEVCALTMRDGTPYAVTYMEDPFQC
jgi:hypothetical protein